MKVIKGINKGERSEYVKARIKLVKASIKKREKSEQEFNLFKKLYLELIETKSLNKDQMRFSIEEDFKKNGYRFNRDKFFSLQNKLRQEEIEKDWWWTKRKAELKAMTGKKIISFLHSGLDFIQKEKSEKIAIGRKVGSIKGGNSTKKKNS